MDRRTNRSKRLSVRRAGSFLPRRRFGFFWLALAERGEASSIGEAGEKKLVEGSHLPVKHTFEKLGVFRPIFYQRHDRYLQRGEAGLEDRNSYLGRVWDRISGTVRQAMALAQTVQSHPTTSHHFTPST